MEFRESQAIYQQVADHVCEMILRQEWSAGQRIPSVRELAMELEVNPNTLNKAYAYLQDRGIIHNQRGIGYFVDDSGLEATRSLKREEFVTLELPRVFRTMDLLEMNLKELGQHLDEYRNAQTKGGKA